MEYSHLVMSIVFDNSTNAFPCHELTEEFCKLLMQTCYNLCKTNKNIMIMCNKYIAIYLYENIHDCMVSSILDSNFAYNNELTKYLTLLHF